MMIVMLSMSLVACTRPKPHVFYDYMDTLIVIDIPIYNKKQRSELLEHIEEIYKTYHDLTNNYGPLSNDEDFKENIYSINQKINQEIEIDKELYDLLQEAKTIHELTNGYFDVSIGKIVDIWKDIILNDEYFHREIPQVVFDQVLIQLQAIEVVEEPFVLTENNGSYFVRLTHEDVKLDLGAISKGYATQLVYDYLIEEGITYFSINAGTSSLSLGKKIDRESKMYEITLANPVENGQYGMLYVQNKAINTSGNFEQYALYNDLRYHHVISPKTKLPAQHYHTVTVIGDDAGLLDALSTALFSMSPDDFEEFIDEHQDTLNLEVIRFNYDESVSTFLLDTVFEAY